MTLTAPSRDRPLPPRPPGRARRHDTEPPLRSLVKGLAVTVVVGFVIWMAISAYNGIPFVSYRTVYVSIPNAGNLLEHDPVRIAGVRVGQVLGKGLASDGRVRLKLQLQPGLQLPVGTAAEVRAQGLLGARYVELIPGHGRRMLANASTIQAPATALTYGLPDALDTFDAQTRGALGTMVRELGTGLLGRGEQLNEAIQLSAGDMVPFQQLAQTILSHPGAAARLLPSLDRMTTALAAERTPISDTFAPGARALTPFADQRTAVRATLAAAPGALSAANAGLSEGEQLLSAAQALADSAQRTLPYAPSGLRALTALLADTHGDLGAATSLLAAAKPAVPAALKLTSSLQPVLSPLGQWLSNLTPMFNQIAPYGCNIENFGAVFRSMTGFGGIGTGPNGPAASFRLTIVPPGLGALGAIDNSGLTARDGYPPPCKYLDTTYPIAVEHSG
ncbi:MAG TPA: MlaD family protein [Solirubrobacteraceae bacterium]|jgi:phospholipid/cholesterol/gamma-HCH transport system substrate-binding protein|nr:MlaD family protein [Solirubrobacteraceae bacterium]